MEDFGNGRKKNALNPRRGSWILAVEDSDVDMYLMQRALDAGGGHHEIKRARNGEQSIEVLQELAEHKSEALPNLIVIDLNLPRIDGHEVLAYLHGNETLQEIAVIVVTSAQGEADRERALAGGADGYFVKPMNIASYDLLPHAMEEAQRVRLTRLMHPPDGRQ